MLSKFANAFLSDTDLSEVYGNKDVKDPKTRKKCKRLIVCRDGRAETSTATIT